MPAKKPNILFLLADDYGAWAMGCSGNREVKTPTLDRLAENGMRFENFFCASPVCSPARASIFTGKIPSQHGVHDWLDKGHLDAELLSDELKESFDDPNRPWYCDWIKFSLEGDKAVPYLAPHKTFTEVLSENGYECGLSGKWHMGDSVHPQAGFDYWKTTAIGAENYLYPVVLENGKMTIKHNYYVTDYIADKAIDFIDQHDEDKPFYLSVHFTAPHAPWDAKDHPAEYIEMYRDCPFDSVPNLPPHPWTKHDVTQSLAQWRSKKNPYLVNRLESAPILETWQGYRKEALRGYYAATTAMDTAIDRILKTLERRGELDNTIIIFTGDNGMSMGHHGIFGKGNGTIPLNMYDTAVKVPAIVCAAEGIQKGVVCKELLSHYDLYETVLDLAGVPFEKPDDLPGVSFAPILRGEQERVRDSVVVYDEYGPCRMIRTKEWKLVRRYPEGPDELYDLVNDPDEATNLIDDPRYTALIDDLSSQLTGWFDRYVDPAHDGTKEAVYGRGQLDYHRFK